MGLVPARGRVRFRSRETVDSRLVLDGVHQPAYDDGRSDEDGKAEGAEADHHPGLRALRNAEDDRSEERKEQDGAEVGKHGFVLRWLRGRLSAVGK